MNEVLGPLADKKPRQSSSKPGNITFTKANHTQVQHPHNNSFFIQLWIHGYDVKWYLVDSNSSVEVMYYDLGKQLKLNMADLKPTQAPLVRINAQAD